VLVSRERELCIWSSGRGGMHSTHAFLHCCHVYGAGVVKSTKMNRTITIRRDYLHYIKKYGR
jgi:hypothetical protein